MEASLGIAERAVQVRLIILIVRWFPEVPEPVSIQEMSVPLHVLEMKFCGFHPPGRSAMLAFCIPLEQ